METVKDKLNFCNGAVFHDFTNIGFTCELNQVSKCKINSFYRTIPHTRIYASLSTIHDIISKFNKNDIEIILENIQDLRENILYMLSFEKLNRDEQHNVRKPLLKDNDDEWKINTQKSHIIYITDIIKIVEKDIFYYINGNNKRCYARDE